MSRKRASRSGGVTAGPQDGQGKTTRGTQPLPTPHRPVVSLALVLFVPALWLVLHGNLSVQTALFRFIGALLVSWVAAWVVFTTVSSYAKTAGRAVAANRDPSSGTVGRTDLSAGGSGSTEATGLGGAGVAG